MKQKSRKIVAENNKMEYNKTMEIVMQEDVEKALKNFKEDKVHMNKTGGGFWKPKSTDCDSKILADIHDQVEPLPNPYDSAAAYFKEMDNIYVESSAPEIRELNVSDSTHIELESTPAKSIVVQNDQDQGVQKEAMTPSCGKVVTKRAQKQVPKKIRRNNSAEALKRLYFKKKIQNAQMERKKLALEIIYMKEEHKLKMVMLKKKINK